MEIMPLAQEQRKRAGETVAAAFFRYPSLVHYFPDEKRRARWLPWYMARVVNCARLFGQVLTTADMSGILFALPPGHTRMSDMDYVKGGLLVAPLVIGLGRYPAVTECEDYLARTQERLLENRPRYYLWGLAVDPRKQRTGAGSALLAAFLHETDAEGVPVYLETHRLENVPYYENRGFSLIETARDPKHHMDFWCLLHEPGHLPY